MRFCFRFRYNVFCGLSFFRVVLGISIEIVLGLD